MATTEVRDGALEALIADIPPDRPLALVNLLRFVDQTEIDGAPLTGRELYERYVRQLEPTIVAVGGRPVFRGQARTMLIGPPDERWDEVVVVIYPSRRAFERLVASKAFQASSPLRLAALSDARLIAVASPQRIGRAVGLLYAASVRLRRSDTRVDRTRRPR